MKDCDTFLMVGSAFPYSEFLPEAGKARGVQIDIDGARLSLRYPMEVNMVGDSAATLRALLPLLKQKTETPGGERIEKDVRLGGRRLRSAPCSSADPINPQRVFWELSKRLPENGIMTGDSGSVANWYARDIKMRRGMMGSLSGGLASLGAATPYAMAAKMAFPGSHRHRLHRRRRHADEWPQRDDHHLQILEGNGPTHGLIVMVLNNRDLNQVTWEERIQLGVGKTESTQSIPDFPYHKYAELFGLKGIFVNDPEKLGAAWDEALAADRPVILECYTDPNVPPLAAAHHAEGREEFHDHDDRRTRIGQRVEEQRQAGSGQRLPSGSRSWPARGNGLVLCLNSEAGHEYNRR